MSKFFLSLLRTWYNAWYAFWLSIGCCYCGKPFDSVMYPFCSEECMIKFGKVTR
jgi:hypothetical protein